MLPGRIATRLKLTAGLTVFAIALPAFTGLDRTQDRDISDRADGDDANRVEARIAPKIPFSLDAWRNRVGAAHEAIRVFVDGSPNKILPAHPPQDQLFPAHEGELSPLATAYAPSDTNWLKRNTQDAVGETTVASLVGDDAEAFGDALAAFRNGDFDRGDAAAARVQGSLSEATARWIGLKLHPKQAGFFRINTFLEQHPGWPGAEWLRRRAEENIVTEHLADTVVRAFFAQSAPLTGYGKYALARALAREGQFDAAQILARDAWREDDLVGLESSFPTELGAFLSVADHKYRADRLLYAGKNTLAIKAADLAGPAIGALARARIVGSEPMVAALPPALQNDPGILFARVRGLRNANRFVEAGAMLRKAPADPEQAVDGDAWWEERRTVARKLLDYNDPATAYTICAEHSAKKTTNKVEAEFQAGWIALRFLNDPTRAEAHFARLVAAAETPLQQSRGHYWRGRAIEALSGVDDSARAHYEKAAAHSTTFYGQLAAAKLGREDTPLRTPPAPSRGEQRAESVRAAELLFAMGEKELASSLALDAAKYLEKPADVAALGEVVTRQKDAKLSLLYGKQASYRGIALDDVAFPGNGVPEYQALPASASRSIVYAIARQESAFDPRAISHAGAMGLMQMIASTAHATAVTKRVPFDISRMLSEPAYNAQLGAAHLGILLHDYRGAYLLTFAAYNAGGGRVKQWIDAYGDPRKPNVDPIDWVERIPIAETRNYVQRVMENFTVYRAKFGDSSTRAPLIELARAGD